MLRQLTHVLNAGSRNVINTVLHKIGVTRTTKGAIRAWLFDTFARPKLTKISCGGKFLPCTRVTLMRQMNRGGNVLWRVNAVFLHDNLDVPFRIFISCVHRTGFLRWQETKEVEYPPFRDCPLSFLSVAHDMTCHEWRQYVTAFHTATRFFSPHKAPAVTPRTASYLSPHEAFLRHVPPAIIEATRDDVYQNRSQKR